MRKALFFAVVSVLLFGDVVSSRSCPGATPQTFLLEDDSGTINSDPDGVGSGSSYESSLDCMWEIRCPSSKPYVAFSSISTNTNHGDFVILSPTRSRNFDLIAKIGGVNTTGLITDRSTVFVHFTSGSIQGAGFTIDYTCHSTMCGHSSPNTTELSSIYTSSSGRLFGLFNNRVLLSNQVCRWQVLCPSSSAAILLYSFAENLLASNGVGANPTYNLDLKGTRHSLPASSMVPKFFSLDKADQFHNGSHSVDIIFHSPVYSSSSLWQYSFIDFRCAQHQCSSPNVSESLFGPQAGGDRSGIIVGGAKSFFADTSQPANLIAVNELCEWTISCGSDEYSAVSVVLESRGITDELVFVDVERNEVLFVNRNPSLRRIFRTPTLRIRMTVNGSTSLATPDFFSVSYRCEKTMCPSNVGVSNAIELRSGSSQRFSFSSHDALSAFEEQECLWHFTCPTSSPFFYFSSSTQQSVSGIKQGTVISISNRFSNALALNITESIDLGQYIFPFTNSSVYIATHAHNGNIPLYFEATCHASLCESQGAKTSDVELPANGSFTFTPFDGQSIPGGSRCAWNVMCPVPSTSLVLQASSIESSRTNTQSRLLLQSISSHGNISVSPMLHSASGVFTSGQNATMYLETDVPSRNARFSFVCQMMQCSSSQISGQTITVERNIPESISTNVRGYDGYVLAKENCTWDVTCSDPQHFPYIYFFNYASLLPPSSLEVIDVSSQRRVDIASEKLIRSDKLRIALATGASSHRGMTLNFTCSQHKCSSANYTSRIQDTSFGSILIGSDESGHDGTIVAGEVCEWTVECPPGTLFTVPSARWHVSSGRLSVHSQDGDILTRSSSASSSFFSSSNTASIIFDNKDGGSGAGAGRVQFSCVPSSVTPSCSAVESPPQFTLKSLSGKIQSDVDGKGPFPLVAKESCSWRISCPASTPDVGRISSVSLTLEFNGPNTSSLMLQVSQPMKLFPLVFEEFKSGVSRKTYNIDHQGNDVFVAVDNRDDHPLVGGYELHYTCVPEKPQCPATSSTSLQALQHGTVSTINVPPYAGTISCIWTPTCQTLSSFLKVAFWGQSSSGEISVLDSSGVNGLFIKESSRHPVEFFIPSSSVSTLAFRQKVVDFVIGRTIQFSCHEHKCEESPKLFSIPRKWETEPLISRNISGTFGSECEWRFLCPENTRVQLSLKLLVDESTTVHVRDTITSGTLFLSPRMASLSQEQTLSFTLESNDVLLQPARSYVDTYGGQPHVSVMAFQCSVTTPVSPVTSCDSCCSTGSGSVSPSQVYTSSGALSVWGDPVPPFRCSFVLQCPSTAEVLFVAYAQSSPYLRKHLWFKGNWHPTLSPQTFSGILNTTRVAFTNATTLPTYDLGLHFSCLPSRFAAVPTISFQIAAVTQHVDLPRLLMGSSTKLNASLVHAAFILQCSDPSQQVAIKQDLKVALGEDEVVEWFSASGGLLVRVDKSLNEEDNLDSSPNDLEIPTVAYVIRASLNPQLTSEYKFEVECVSPSTSSSDSKVSMWAVLGVVIALLTIPTVVFLAYIGCCRKADDVSSLNYPVRRSEIPKMRSMKRDPDVQLVQLSEPILEQSPSLKFDDL